MNTVTLDQGLVPFAYESIASSDTAQGLTLATYTTGHKAQRAMITLETKSIRYRVDGGTPVISPASGHKLDAGDVLNLNNYADIAAFSFISEVAGQAGTLRVTYYY